MYIIGVDVGASHIGVGIVEKETIKVIYRDNILYDYRELNDSIFVNILIEAISKALQNEVYIEYIGIGMPGEIDREAGIFLGNEMMNLGVLKLSEILQNKFRIKTYVTNDCTLAALSEIYYGALKNLDCGFMFTIGSGVGTTVYKKQSINNSKEILLSDDIFWQYLYNLNSDKKIKSLRKIAKLYNTEDRSKIFRDVQNNNKQAKEILQNVINDYYIGITRIYDNVGVEHFCIGGGISEYSNLFIEPLNQLFINSDKYNCIQIYKCKFNNDSAIIGATLLPDNFKRMSTL